MSNSWRMIDLQPGAHWPRGDDGRRLLVKANRVAQDLNRRLLIKSGFRTEAEQRAAYQDYLHGGNLAAYCCPCQSNHCRSRALDIGVIGKSGAYHSIGLYKGAIASIHKHGLVLPLWQNGRYIEPWHMTEARYPG